MPKRPDPADRAKAGNLNPDDDFENADWSDDDGPHTGDDDGPHAGDGGGDAWGRADPPPKVDPVDRAARFAAGKLSSLTRPAFDQMRRRRSGEERPVPLPWPRLSEELHGGLWAGCWILVGGTGVGKSQWAFEVAYNAAVRHECPVAYVGLELDETGLVARLAALGMHGENLAGPDGRPERVPWSGLYLGRGDPSPLRWFDGPEPQGGWDDGRAGDGGWPSDTGWPPEPGPGAKVLAALDAAPFYLETGDARGGASGWSYREITRIAEDLRAAHPDGPALLVVDFLQLVGPDPNADHREDLRERIGNAAYAARMAARKHNITVLLLSATARGYYSLFAGKGAKGENIPDLGSGDSGRFVGTGKESGETEYSADGVLALCRSPWPKGAAAPDVWLAVAKARTGRGPEAGWCCYGFDGTAFTEKDPPPPPPPEDTPAGSSKNKRGRSYEPVED